MAMQEANPAAELPCAQVVGNVFVEQYYHILHHSPDLVYKFYQDSSVLSRQDLNGIMTSVTTLDAINEKVQSLDYKNCKAEITTADAQESYQTGVIVLVTGSLTGQDNVRRKFTQTFFLAPQERGYFVLNDIFRYVEESEKLEINSTPVNSTNNTVSMAPSTSDPDPTHVPANPAFDPSSNIESENHEDLHNGPEVHDPSDNDEGSALEEEVVNEPPTHSSQNDTSTVISSDSSAALGEKKSYASIVQKAVATSASVYVPTSNLRWAPTNTSQQTLGSPKPSPSPEPEALAPSSDSACDSTNAQEDVEGYSIYIRNLPLNATVTELEEEFGKFGPINRGGVQVRSNKQQGFCFGFVEFKSLDSMQSAIKGSPIRIGPHLAVVEEKRTTTRVGSSGRGTRYPPGRGGFRNDNFRRRGGFGGSRGYGRSEFRNQGEFSSRPQGHNTESSYRRVDQNGSGRIVREAGVDKSGV